MNARPRILYTVRTLCRDATQRDRYLGWLVPDHIRAVKAGGATTVRVVLPDRSSESASAESPEPVERAPVEVQYVFPSRPAFDSYLREHAPGLRGDLLKNFPADSGLTFERQIAEIITELD